MDASVLDVPGRLLIGCWMGSAVSALGPVTVAIRYFGAWRSASYMVKCSSCLTSVLCCVVGSCHVLWRAGQLRILALGCAIAVSWVLCLMC